MAKKAVEFKVGIVVLFGTIMTIAMILWLQGFQFGQSHERIKVAFKEVGGLKKGDLVSVSGVNKGKVADVDLSREGVIAELVVEDDAFLHTDARFIVKNYGMMGERFVYIEPGRSGQPLDLSQVMVGENDPGTSELIGMFGNAVADVQQILVDIRHTIASEKNLNTLVDLGSSLNDLAIRLNEFFLDNRGSMKNTFVNFERISDKLNNFIDTTAIKVDTVLNNFADASVSLNGMLDSLERITHSISEFMRKVDEGEGTLGLLGADETLYRDVKKMVQSVEAIIDDIRRDPKKYLNVEVKIF